jgi:hypothetical protein
MFNKEAMREGLILHCRDPKGFFGRAIRFVLKSWGNHDAMICRFAGQLWIGHTAPPKSHLEPLAYYEDLMNDRKNPYQVRVYEVVGATPEIEGKASEWWLRHVNGKPYDKLGVAELIMLAIVNRLPWNVGIERKFYCTEGVGEAYERAGKDFIGPKDNPTPRTIENRLAAGLLRDVTETYVRLV